MKQTMTPAQTAGYLSSLRIVRALSEGRIKTTPRKPKQRMALVNTSVGHSFEKIIEVDFAPEPKSNLRFENRSLGGKNAAAGMTQSERQERAAKAARARWDAISDSTSRH